MLADGERRGREGVSEYEDVPTLFFCGAFDTLANLECQFTQPLDSDFLSWVQQPEDVLHGYADLLDQVYAAAVQQPPA